MFVKENRYTKQPDEPGEYHEEAQAFQDYDRLPHETKQPDEAAVELLRRMWKDWCDPRADGDDVFAYFGEEIKALLAALQADTPDKEMGDG